MAKHRQSGPLVSAALSLAALMVLLLFSPSWSAGPGSGPAPGQKPLSPDGRMQIGIEDRCPVCGMKVAQYAQFSSAIKMLDNSTYYFCSCGCMLRAWLHPDIFLATVRGELKTPVIREYFTGDQLDGRTVFWVAGSDVVGPMGPALVPIHGADALETFKRRHGGKAFFLLEELTPDKWFAITGRKAAK